jgi:isoleucyl-tRNA synthetase
MKQSKSLGNYVNAQDEAKKYGSDILRLWVASVNYQEDIRCNDELIGRIQDAYRKIRNTLRYLLGNIDDFDPNKNSVGYNDMFEIDKWAMQQLQKLIAEVMQAYDDFIFHRVFMLIHNFCAVEMSSIYMDLLKDRMYCDAADSLSRRSAQTAMYKILDALVRMLAPILVHTAEEVWELLKTRNSQPATRNADSIHLAQMPKVDASIDYLADESKWRKLMSLRDKVLLALEPLRKDKIIGSNQESSVTMHCNNDDAAAIEQFGVKNFAALCIVSEVKLEKGEAETTVSAQKSPHQKCQRCWNYWSSVGQDAEYKDVCQRCADTLKHLNV